MAIVKLEVSKAAIKALRRKLSVNRFDAIAAKAMTRVAFDVREAEAELTGRSFEFSGSGTKGFVANKRSFVFSPKPSAKKLRTTIEPREQARSALRDHATGGSIFAAQARRLSYGTALAAPIKKTTKRSGGRGQVSPSIKPGALKQRGRAFVIDLPSGNQLLLDRKPRRGRKKKQRERTSRSSGRGGSPKRLLNANKRDPSTIARYVLIERTKLPRTYEFNAHGIRVAKRMFPKRMGQEIAKAIARDRASKF